MKKINSDFAVIVFIIISLLGLIVITILGANRKLSIDDERKKCQEIVMGTFMHDGTEGYCDTYTGGDGDLHYKYVQIKDSDTQIEKDVYIIWETGKAGQY